MYTPTLVSLDVTPTHVTAELSGDAITGLKLDLAKQTVAANAVKAANADILVAPRFIPRYTEGKLSAVTVIGYPAKITGFRPLTAADEAFVQKDAPVRPNVSKQAVIANTTVADLKVLEKQTIALTEAEMAGMNEKKALAYAQQKMRRDFNADLLLDEQYEYDIESGMFKSAMYKFVFTAYPAHYTNYRSMTKEEQLAVRPENKATVYYNIVADTQQKTEKVQKTYTASELGSTDAGQLRTLAREKVLTEYDADIVLDEYFYYDYTDKVITSITICGTPAAYQNFHELTAQDVVSLNASGDNTEEAEPVGFWQSILNLFKKK